MLDEILAETTHFSTSTSLVDELSFPSAGYPVSLIFNSLSECRPEDSLAIKDELDSPSLRAVLVAAVYLVSKFGKTLHQHKASAWASVENKESTSAHHKTK